MFLSRKTQSTTSSTSPAAAAASADDAAVPAAVAADDGGAVASDAVHPYEAAPVGKEAAHGPIVSFIGNELEALRHDNALYRSVSAGEHAFAAFYKDVIARARSAKLEVSHAFHTMFVSMSKSLLPGLHGIETALFHVFSSVVHAGTTMLAHTPAGMAASLSDRLVQDIAARA